MWMVDAIWFDRCYTNHGLALRHPHFQVVHPNG